MTCCSNCTEPLNEAQWDDGQCWKSCPQCSERHRSEHVFYQYSEMFGTTLARATPERQEGAQSWCTNCRANQEPNWAQSRLCSNVLPPSGGLRELLGSE